MPLAWIRPTTLAVLLSVCTAPSHAQAPAEHLIAPLPAAYKPAGKVSGQSSVIEIFRPPGQTDDNWSEQIMLQTSTVKASVEPGEMLQSLARVFLKSCNEATPASIARGKVNGYATATTLFKCPLAVPSGKPETSLIHAILGNDHIYLVHQARRYVPARDEVKQMIGYLGTVTVCDDRTPGHPCPPPKPAP